ncbi:DUF5667 domain-containing protein [Geosporobacter ferrireducens]|uniref:DUF5667 domain-containing protein n=1 Tax=Geosporobacter ferrireducens TaxID=1424294 RepID=UPI00139D25DD|nr:DUF5667 domain-containing protein [Geosporobacter ferrireducens]MTI57050.1 helix-turn-helix domain-containing protein [Geosporobacter ferrireducens]
MKKAIISGLMAGLLTITPVFADTTNIVEAAPGITPDSVFYVVDRWVEDIQLAFNGNPEKKAALLHQMSLERLAEAERMLEENKEEHVNTAFEGYIFKLELIQEIIGELIINEDISDEIKEMLSNRLEELTEIRDETIAVVESELKVKIEEKVDSAYLVANIVKGLDVEKVKALRSEMKLGYGQIAHVFRLADAADLSVEEVAELLSQGKGIGQIAKELNVHPSALKGKNKKAVHIDVNITAENADQEEVEEDKEGQESLGAKITETAKSEKVKKQIKTILKDSEKKYGTVLEATSRKEGTDEKDNQEETKTESQEKEENPKVKESKESEKKKEVVKQEERVKSEKSESVSKDNNGKKKN